MKPEELWQELVDETGDALVEEAAAVSLAQAEEELVAAGFDLAEVYGQSDAFIASLRGSAIENAAAAEPMVASAVDQEAPRRVEPRERKPRPIPVWIAAAAATVAAGAAVAYVAMQPNEGPRPAPTTPPSTVPPAPPPEDLIAVAQDLRMRAAAACNVGRFDTCLTLLDEAKAKDPAGDTADEVQTLRRQANGDLNEPKKKSK